MTDDEFDPLVARLRASGPTRGLGVDFQAVAQEVGRRDRRRRTVRGVAASAVSVAAIAVAAQTLGGLFVGGGTASSGMAAGPASAQAEAAAPSGDPAASVRAAGADGQTATAAATPQARTALGCPTSVPPVVAPPEPTVFGTSLSRGLSVPEAPGPAVLAALPQLQDQLLAAAGARSAVICRYDAPPRGEVAQWALSAQLPVTVGLTGLTSDLAAVPPAPTSGPSACPGAGAPGSVLLLRVDYAAGSVWVAAETGGACGATNGVVTTGYPVGVALRRLAETGQWTGL